MYGDGSQTRSFCYVSDLARGLHALMNNEVTTGPVNLGNPGARLIALRGGQRTRRIPTTQLGMRPDNSGLSALRYSLHHHCKAP